MKYIEIPRYIADFETTVNDDTTTQDSTEVWAFAIVDANAKDEITSVKVGHSITEFMEYIDGLGTCQIYFHNLKFDGSFILYYLCMTNGYREYLVDGVHDSKAFSKNAKKGHYTYLISDMGIWYEIKIKTSTGIVTIKDSLKLLPLSVATIGKSFNTKHQKTSIEYKGYRYAGCEITPQEKEYIANDVLVVKEAINFMWSEGHTKSTIGSCCLSEYKYLWGDKTDWINTYPDLSQITAPAPFNDMDNYIRKSYKGGYCYVNRAGLKHNGCTADVNSLYPSVMHSVSGNKYPIGKPAFFTGKPDFNLLDSLYNDGTRKYYYFIRLKCCFELKPNYLPTIQIKGTPLYRGTEWLKTSDYIDKQGVKHHVITNENGETETVKPELVLCMTDYWLLMSHYNVTEIQYIDGCYFRCYCGIFDSYIDKYGEIKRNSTGGKRQIAKLFLNNLYGKFATSPDSSYQLITLDKDGYFNTECIHEEKMPPVYIAIGSAITGYARYFTITHAQENYAHFCYADTDSIHCDCSVDDLRNITIHDTDFLAWKIENEWDKAIFVRQKTYIEHTIKEDRKPCNPFYMVKCAGMGKEAKQNIVNDLESGKMVLTDFKRGYSVKGNLKARRIKGGTLLVECDFNLR